MILSSVEIRLFLTIWLVYAIYVTPAGGVTPNRYVDLVHSIVNEGRFEIDTYHENTIDKAYYNGHYYAGALPGPAFLAVPAYVVFKGLYLVMPQSFKDLAGGIESYQKQKQANSSFYGRVDNVEFFLSQTILVISVLGSVSALGSVLLFKSVQLFGYENKVALMVTLFYAFGTIVFFYSTVFFEQVFTATCAIGAFYFVAKTVYQPRDPRISLWTFVAGLFAGFGLLIEYTSIIVSIWLGFWVLANKRLYLLIFSLAFGVSVIILLAYNYVLFGNPFTTPYAYLIPEFGSVHGVGFFGATYPRLDRFVALTIGDERGLFVYMPIILVGVVGVIEQILKKGSNASSALVIAFIFVTYILFFSAYTNWRGGAAFGPRYLMAILPLACLGVAFAFHSLSRLLVSGLGVLSVLVNWLGAQFGFAASIFQPFQSLWSQGPTLPAFEAILTHLSNQTGSLYLFALNYHILITVAVTAGLVAMMILLWRDVQRLELKS